MNTETILNQILQRLNAIDGHMAGIDSRLTNIENTMITKEHFEKLYTESQKDVMTLLETKATKESISTLNAKLDLLNDRAFQQETKLKLIESR